MNEKIRIRVRKLLALSTSSNPSEAKSARDKAETLAAGHGLSLKEFENETEIIEEALRVEPGEILYWDHVLLSGLLAHCAVEALYIPVGSLEKIILVGHAPNIVKLRKLYDYLFDRLISLGEDYEPVVRDLNSFRLGMAQSVCLALEDLAPRYKSPTGDRELIPAVEDAAALEIDEYLKEIYSSLKERDQRESFDSNSLGLGKAVGRKISLLTQLDQE